MAQLIKRLPLNHRGEELQPIVVSAFGSLYLEDFQGVGSIRDSSKGVIVTFATTQFQLIQVKHGDQQIG